MCLRSICWAKNWVTLTAVSALKLFFLWAKTRVLRKMSRGKWMLCMLIIERITPSWGGQEAVDIFLKRKENTSNKPKKFKWDNWKRITLPDVALLSLLLPGPNQFGPRIFRSASVQFRGHVPFPSIDPPITISCSLSSFGERCNACVWQSHCVCPTYSTLWSPPGLIKDQGHQPFLGFLG